MMIYFDNAATSWPKPEAVYKAVEDSLRNTGNAGRGGNVKSLSASRVLYGARAALAEFFGAPSIERMILTQNITEALNLALKGILVMGDHVVISPYEHNAVVRVLEYLKVKRGITYTIANEVAKCDFHDHAGIVAAFERELRENTRLLCVTHASNVLGTILPIAEIGAMANRNGILFLVDSAQTAGTIPIDVSAMGIDILTFTGHKSLLGPQGTGGLYIKQGIDVTALIHGGTGSQSALMTQPQIYPEALESGTRNIPGIAGLLAGVEYCKQYVGHIRDHEMTLIGSLLSYMKDNPKFDVYGPVAPIARVGLVAFNVRGKQADSIGYDLEQTAGIATRTGLHCSPLAHRVNGTLESGAIRVSVGAFNTKQEIDRLIEALEELTC